MKITPPAEPVKPACHNRPPLSRGHWRYGTDQYTGEPIKVWIDSTWSEDRCNAWAGRGIGSTEATTHYPAAHGWAEFCKTCRWLPVEARDALAGSA